MTIKELNKKLVELKVDNNRFYLNGIYGSDNYDNKLALTVSKENEKLIYEIFYSERGEKHSEKLFLNETEACKYFLYQIQEELTTEKALKVIGLGGMTVNERLWETGLMEEFDSVKRKDKQRAKQILRILGVDNSSIKKIVGIIIFLILLSCNNEKVKFSGLNDLVVGVQQVLLYESGNFYLELGAGGAKGTYHIENDTVFLNYMEKPVDWPEKLLMTEDFFITIDRDSPLRQIKIKRN